MKYNKYYNPSALHLSGMEYVVLDGTICAVNSIFIEK